MIGTILFFGGFALMIGLMALLYDRTQSSGYSEAYYKYLNNNKQPPPSYRDDIHWMDR